MGGAARHAYKMELIDDIGSFYRRVGIILNHDGQLERLGFKLEYVSGGFGPSWIGELLEFCAQNPEYHIVTMTIPGRLENRYVPGRNLHHLANGDKNPCLVFHPFATSSSASLFMEKVASAISAIISDVNRGD